MFILFSLDSSVTSILRFVCPILLGFMPQKPSRKAMGKRTTLHGCFHPLGRGQRSRRYFALWPGPSWDFYPDKTWRWVFYFIFFKGCGKLSRSMESIWINSVSVIVFFVLHLWLSWFCLFVVCLFVDCFSVIDHVCLVNLKTQQFAGSILEAIPRADARVAGAATATVSGDCVVSLVIETVHFWQ